MKCINCGAIFDPRKASSNWERFRRRIFRNMKRSFADRTGTFPGDSFTCSLRCKKAIRGLRP